jgi:hypothetical protein
LAERTVVSRAQRGRSRDRASAIQVGQAIGMLLEAGPELRRPLAEQRYEDYLKQEDIR